MDNTPPAPLNASTSRTPYRRPSEAGKKLRRIVFTLNNWTQEEYDKIIEMPCTWMIVAKEIAPTTGTPHLQGACILGTQMSFSKVKTLIGSRVNFQPMRGTPADSIVYCSKEDLAPFVKGTPPTPGKRSNLEDTVDAIKEGSTLRQLATSDQSHGALNIVRYHKGLTVLRSLIRPPRTGPPKVIWLFGPTGTGKTRCAYEAGLRLVDGPDNIWISSGGLKWFDGYDGQPVVIFDDFRAKHVSNFAYLLRLLDRYPMQVEFKGGFVGWTPEYIFITCPTEPDECFSKRKEHVPEDIAQLHRRITKVLGILTVASDDTRSRIVNTILELCGTASVSSGDESDRSGSAGSDEESDLDPNPDSECT